MLKWLWRWAKRLLIALVVLALLMWALIALAPGFGAAPKGERLARMQASPQWQGDRFHNPQPMWNNFNALERGDPASRPHRTPTTARTKWWRIPPPDWAARPVRACESPGSGIPRH